MIVYKAFPHIAQYYRVGQIPILVDNSDCVNIQQLGSHKIWELFFERWQAEGAYIPSNMTLKSEN